MTLRTLTSFGAAVLLAGCSFSTGGGTPTETRSKIAELAKGALTEEVGQEPDELDCGDGTVEVVEDEVVDCTLTHDGVTYAVTVTIVDVDGTDYRIEAVVADQPIDQPAG